MIYQFEYEGFNVCGDCPCWWPDIISEGCATAEGCCYINFEKRNRFTEKPIDCPLLIVSKADKEIGKEPQEPCEWCGDSKDFFDVNWYRAIGEGMYTVKNKPNFCPNCGADMREAKK